MELGELSKSDSTKNMLRSVSNDTTTATFEDGKLVAGSNDQPPARFSHWLVIDVVVLCVLSLMVWGLLTLPIIFYELPNDYELGMVVSAPIDEDQTCNASIYTGMVCNESLRQLQSCLPGRESNSTVYISPPENRDVGDIEREAGIFVQVGIPNVNPSPSAQCAEEIVPFICLYYFRLCDGGTLYVPTFEECRRLRDDVCTIDVWNAANVGAASLMLEGLPDCDLLPNRNRTSIECEGDMVGVGSGEGSAIEQGSTITENTTESTTNSTTGGDSCTIASGRECLEDFYCRDDFCRPLCKEWEINSHDEIVATISVTFIVGIVCLIGSVVVLVISGIRWRTMLTFPYILLVYMIIALIVVALFLLISLSDSENRELFCSSDDLLDTLEDSTTYCNIIGAVFYYCTFQMAVWWFFLVGALFLTVIFPEQMKLMKEDRLLILHVIHLIVVLVGLILPLVPVITIFAGEGVYTTRFPTIICFAEDNNATFYPFALLMIILAMLGTPLMLTVAWIGHKKLCWPDLHYRVVAFGPPERKLLAVLCYFLCFILTAIVAFTADARNSDQYIDELRFYFACESTGHDPENPCTRDFEDYSFPGATTLAYVLIALFPLVVLIFVIDIKDLKHCCTKTHEKYSFKNREKIDSS